MEKNG